MRIVICASEMVPFAKTGGLADVIGALPHALEELGHEVVVFIPKYKEVSQSGVKLRRLNGRIFYAGVGKNIKVYFPAHDAYFNRDGLYQEKGVDYPDNLERFCYYSRRVLEQLKEINFCADIIHAHDWQAGLIPLYLKTVYKDDPFYKKIKTLLTIHNLGYQGLFPKEEFPKLGLPSSLFTPQALEFYGRINILKGSIVFSDIINTVSPTYSREIRSKEFGYGLEGVLGNRKEDLFGILNGIDYSIWNPETDKFILKNYSAEGIAGKKGNKEGLRKICKLKLSKDVPLFGMVSRLAGHKGFDLLIGAMEEILKMDLEMVILGLGDKKYETALRHIAGKQPKKICVNFKFDDPLAHKIYAAADIFLMPSHYEPCGLSQMISLRYGTIPLVFKTGGLADTINKENGFIFEHYTKEALLKAISDSIEAFKMKKKWDALVLKAMQYDFSWKEAARRYTLLYEKACNRK